MGFKKYYRFTPNSNHFCFSKICKLKNFIVLFLVATLNSVYSPVFAQCSGSFDGTFGIIPVGEFKSIYDWSVANTATDVVKVANQGNEKGAIIRNVGLDHFSLKHRATVAPSASYVLSFNFSNWSAGCLPGHEDSKIEIKVYKEGSDQPFYFSGPLSAGNLPSFTNLEFTTPANTTSVNVVIVDAGTTTSTSCGTFIDNIALLAPLQFSVTSENISCLGTSGGSVSLSLSGAIPPYQVSYSYNSGGFTAPISANSGTTNFSNLLAGNYDFKVSDSKGCFDTREISITQDELSLTFTQTPQILKCNGGTASISITANDGSGQYEYKKGNGLYQPSNVFNNIGAGTHNFVVKDKITNCETLETIVIEQPALLTLSEAHLEICDNGGTSSVTLTSTGGTGNKLYKKGTGEFTTNNIFGRLSEGNYTFYVKDANECTAFVVANILKPPLLTLQETHTQIVCNGGTSTVTLNSSGGSGAKEYRLENGPLQGSNIFSGISAGNYTFYVEDANCEKSVSIVIQEPLPVLFLEETHTSILCNGGTSTVTLKSTGGTGNKQYRSGNGPYQPSNVFSNLIAGTYTFEVKDENNCTTSPIIIIPAPPLLTLSEIHTPICNGNTTKVTLTATGGAGTKQYKLGDDGTFNFSNEFNNIPAGNYIFYVKDANNCQIAHSVSITKPPLLTISETHTPITCYGGRSVATVKSLGGVEPKQFRYDNKDYSNSNIFEGLTAGTHTFFVKDANNCEVSITYIIPQPSVVILLKENHTDILCKGGTSTVTLTSQGGTGVIQYKNGNGPYQPSNVFPGLKAGSYNFEVKDVNGCSTSPNIVITEPDSLKLTGIPTAQTCGEGGTTVTLQTTGGTGVSQFRKGNGSYQPANIFSGLAAGNYIFFAKDKSGCEAKFEITLLTSPALSLTEDHAPIKCKGGTTSVTLSSIGGSGGIKQFKKGDAGEYSDSYIFNDLNAGSYAFWVRDVNLCEKRKVVIITEPLELILKENHTNIFCNSTTTTVTLEASGGSGNNRYKYGSGLYQSNNVFNGIPAGNANFFVKDSTGCEKSVSANIEYSPSTLVGSILVNSTSCKLTANGKLTANISGGTKPYSYDWSNGGTENIITNLAAADYQLTVTDVNGCTLTLETKVPNGNCTPIANNDSLYVLKNSTFRGIVTANDIDPDDNYPLKYVALTQTINGTIELKSDGSFIYNPNLNYKGLDSFTYQTCDALGACDELTTVNLIIIDAVTATFTTSLTEIKEGGNTNLSAKLSKPLHHNVTITLKYVGTAEEDKDYSLSSNYATFLILAGDTSSNQNIIVTAIKDDIKEGSEQLKITIDSTSSIFVNNGPGAEITLSDLYPSGVPPGKDENKDINPDPLFSPNGDGEGNDIFMIYNIIKYPNNEVIIFNRLGKEVFRIEGYNNKDQAFKGIANRGLLSNSDADLVEGVYYYIIYTTDETNKKKTNKGYIILKR